MVMLNLTTDINEQLKRTGSIYWWGGCSIVGNTLNIKSAIKSTVLYYKTIPNILKGEKSVVYYIETYQKRKDLKDISSLFLINLLPECNQTTLTDIISRCFLVQTNMFW